MMISQRAIETMEARIRLRGDYTPPRWIELPITGGGAYGATLARGGVKQTVFGETPGDAVFKLHERVEGTR